MIIAQEAALTSDGGFYRSEANPYYWKNKKPYEGYWQQDVQYNIKASIDDELDIISGDFYKLTYWNNSPHQITELYFHLHQNAFQPNSHYHDLNKNNKVPVKFGNYEKQGLGTTVEKLRVNGDSVATVLDNTILKVILNKPLKSGESLEVTMKFKTYYDTGSMRRRMKKIETSGTKHFDGVQWYPALAVYDRKFGWETEQDLDKEYYGDFGSFDVQLTFPQEYIVEATGDLQNRTEVMPDSLRKKLDISNFVKKSPTEPSTIIIPKEKGKTKTWVFHADNVHNFAFTADPLYRISEIEWRGVRVIALAQEPHAAGWVQSALFTMNVIKVYSDDFGMYAWPKIIVADAKDGMEYPMLTLDGGTYPQHQSLLAHEVGHMWFYGMLGNNETYRAYLDEGFTQFLTVWSMDRLVGPVRARMAKNKFMSKHLDSSDTRYENLYYPYINHVIEGYDEPLNTHSSGFNGGIRHGGSYGLVYYKTGVMLYNLIYVLGEELFLKAMQHYVEKWKFAHPYPEDFRDAIIEYTHADLNWFFDQWLETTKYIDYSIQSVKKLDPAKVSGQNDVHEITFKRIGRMQMPIDFTVKTEDGKSYNYHIPNTWFVKKTNATVLPMWYGWDLLHPEYYARISVPGKIKSVVIDPQRLMADIDLTNNVKGDGGISKWEIDHRIPNLTTWHQQKNYYRPDLWYNSLDGVQIGAHAEGSYQNKFSYFTTAWFNTGALQSGELKGLKHQWFAFAFNDKFSLNKISRNTSLTDAFSYNAGIINTSLGLEKIFRKQDQRNPRYSKIFLQAKYLITEKYYRDYLLYPNEWGRGMSSDPVGLINGSLNFGYFKNYVYNSNTGEFTISARVPAIKSDFNYSWLNLNSLNRINYKKFEIKSRVFGQIGFGTFAKESALYLAGANPEQLIENKYTRARAFVPNEWQGYETSVNHFHHGGGLNLRGYAGYLALDRVNGTEIPAFSYAGNSGAAWNVEIDFDKYVKIPAKGITKNLKLDTYLFSDLGIINYKVNGKNQWGSLRMDAGLGSSLSIKFSPYNVNPLVIRFDLPLFLNTPPAGSEYLDLRYVIGINRAF
jgi:aminopeptidase N